ncbi:MAG TPA: HAMP domain-containing sensor histidine kinase [Pirellulales bacterium]|nr:HAMP domain-containing sensor histidine kinase [Pirellulales bacterium]
MRSPWQVWLAFGVCLAVIVAAVGWLSFRALESDRAEAAARRQAGAEASARLALWRIDSALAPLVTQESARPYFSYGTLYPAERAPNSKSRTKGAPEPNPSPLVTDLPPQILLHFQIDSAGRFSSPRVPAAAIADRVVPKYLSAEQVAESKRLLDRVKSLVDPPKLLTMLPPPELPVEPSGQIALNNGSNGSSQLVFGANSGLLSNPQGNSANNAYSNPSANQAPSQRVSAEQAQVQQPSASQAASENQGSGKPTGDPQSDNQRQQPGGNEFRFRSQYLAQNFANAPPQNEVINWPDGPGDERTALMTPIWLGDQLILARRVHAAGKELIQGCLLNWPAIEKELLSAIGDLLPDAKLSAVTAPAAEEESRRSAVLPVRLEIGVLPELIDPPLSPVRLSLVLAWSSMLLGAMAVAMLLRGVMSLSERRAAFVSAVTHELRTPLTTFRMYSEMLAEGMVPDEASRHRYLDTLRIEADRLTHLVENVLAYSRLERNKPGNRVGPVSVSDLLATAANRLADRAHQAGFELAIEAGDEVRGSIVVADPAAVEQILFNLVDNACKYAATATDRILRLGADVREGRFHLRLRDQGPGIDPARRRTLFQPFRKSAQDAAVSAPGVGLGLALCRRLARDMGGDLRYEPPAGGGACFALSLSAHSIGQS